MADQHRAMPWQWETIERNHHHAEFSCLLELHDRIKALEAARQAHDHPLYVIDPEREKNTQELLQSAGFAPRWSEFKRCADSIDALNEAKPADSQPQPDYPAKPDSSPLCVRCWAAAAAAAHTHTKPNHPEIPGSSLKERIRSRMIESAGSTWDVIAASVLVEVADWLNTKKRFDVAIELRVEAER